jgi:hypothetical protein
VRDLAKDSHSARDKPDEFNGVHHGPVCFRPSLQRFPVILNHSSRSHGRAVPAIRIGNRFIPRPDELVSYGGGVFDIDCPHPLMTAKPGADGVLNAPVFHGRQFPDYGKRPGQCREWGF